MRYGNFVIQGGTLRMRGGGGGEGGARPLNVN